MILLYDLAGAGDRRFSSNCWRTRFALAHKGLAIETRATRFIDIPALEGGGYPTVPIIRDGDDVIVDSWRIATFLEARYPAPSLFDHPGVEAFARQLQSWLVTAVSPALLKVFVLDLHARLDPADQTYFRQSRERRFEMTLEQLADGPRETRIAAARTALGPLREALADTSAQRPFLGGVRPLYPDYLAAAALMWPRAVSPGPLLSVDDPILRWFERMLDLFDGLARRAHKEWDGP
jgi:glutathione S-transferase